MSLVSVSAALGVLNLWGLVSAVQVSCVTQHILLTGSLDVAQECSRNKQCTPYFTVLTVVNPSPEGYPVKHPKYLCPVTLHSEGKNPPQLLGPVTNLNKQM